MLGAELHWLSGDLPFMTQQNVDTNELHLWHLGRRGSSRVCGGVLWFFCYEALPNNPEENMGELWDRICARCRSNATATHYGNLTLSSCCKPRSPKEDFPSLKGKNPQINDILRPLLEIWCDVRPAYHFETVRDMPRNQVSIQDNLEPPRRRCVFASCSGIPSGGRHRQFFALYFMLVNAADLEHRLFWNMTPKFHFFYHWARTAAFLNPRRSNCMQDEDYVGLIKVWSGVSWDLPLQSLPGIHEATYFSCDVFIVSFTNNTSRSKSHQQQQCHHHVR